MSESQGQVFPVLSNLELLQIAQGLARARGQAGFKQEELQKLGAWADGIRFQQALVDGLVTGQFCATWDEATNGPLFHHLGNCPVPTTDMAAGMRQLQQPDPPMWEGPGVPYSPGDE